MKINMTPVTPWPNTPLTISLLPNALSREFFSLGPVSTKGCVAW